MSLKVEKLGYYKKLKGNKDILLDETPKKLNTDPKLYGDLENPLDLTLGVENFADEGGGEKLESILNFIDQSSFADSPLMEIVESDFVCCRRFLKRISHQVYNYGTKYECQKFYAFRYADVIFLHEPSIEWLGNYKQYSYSGYKFEQYMTLNEDGTVPDYTETAKNDEDVKCVIRATLSQGDRSFRIFYGAAIDAIDENDEHVDVKVVRDSDEWFKTWSLFLYLQSIFGGSKYAVLGMIDGHAIHTVEKIEIEKLTEVKNKKWREQVCTRYLHEVLAQVKSKLTKNNQAIMATNINVGRYKCAEFKYTPVDPTTLDFVPNWFLNRFR